MVDNIIEIRVNDKGTNLSPGAGSKGGTTGGGLMAAGGKLGVIAGAALAIFSVLKDMLWVFKPVMNILKAISKTLGLFLQPIAELLFLLIRPLLDFIRPLALLFRAMMMPVMGLLREQSAVMSQQMAGGDFAGATQTGMDMIGLALGGFFIALANTVGQVLIGVMGNLLETLANGLISGITYLLLPMMNIIDKIFKTDLTNKLLESSEALKENVSANFAAGIAYASEALYTGTQIMMDGLVGFYSDRLDAIKSTVEIKLPEAVAPFDNVIANTSSSVGGQVAALNTNVNTSLTSMGTNVNRYMGGGLFGGSIPQNFNNGLQSMQSGIDTFVSAAESAGNRISRALRSAESESRKIRVLGVTVATID